MKGIWMVSMGIGEMVNDRKPIRFFENKKDALNWVKKHFESQIKTLIGAEKQEYNSSYYGLNIGNSFCIDYKEIEEGESKK